MDLIIAQNNELDTDHYISEKIILLKKIEILEAENNQLLQEFLLYKKAYERWACNKFAMFIKKIMRKA